MPGMFALIVINILAAFLCATILTALFQMMVKIRQRPRGQLYVGLALLSFLLVVGVAMVNLPAPQEAPPPVEAGLVLLRS